MNKSIKFLSFTPFLCKNLNTAFDKINGNKTLKSETITIGIYDTSSSISSSWEGNGIMKL